MIPLERAMIAGMRALLGEITPAMRVATIEVTDRRILLRVYHTGEASDELRDDLDAAGTEILSEVPWDAATPPEVDVQLLRCDEPSAVSVEGWPIFARKGTIVREARIP